MGELILLTNLFYCLNCMRVFKSEDKCDYCNSENIELLKKDAPVNVMGSKLKGRLLRVNDNTVSLIIITENKDKVIKEYDASKLRKIL